MRDIHVHIKIGRALDRLREHFDTNGIHCNPREPDVISGEFCDAFPDQLSRGTRYTWGVWYPAGNGVTELATGLTELQALNAALEANGLEVTSGK